MRVPTTRGVRMLRRILRRFFFVASATSFDRPPEVLFGGLEVMSGGDVGRVANPFGHDM